MPASLNPIIETSMELLAIYPNSPALEILDEFRKSKDPYRLRELGRQIRDELYAQGIDAVRYRSPTTPNAKWELAVFDERNCRRLRIVPDPHASAHDSIASYDALKVP